MCVRERLGRGCVHRSDVGEHVGNRGTAAVLHSWRGNLTLLIGSPQWPHSIVLWRRLLSAPLTPSDEGARRQQRARARVLCRSLGAASGWLEHWRALCRGAGAGSVCGCDCNEDASVYLSQRHAYQGHSVDAESAGLGHRYRMIEPLPFLTAGSLVIDAVSNLHSEHVLRIGRVRRATSCVP